MIEFNLSEGDSIMKMKRSLILILALLIAISALFTSCNGPGGSSANQMDDVFFDDDIPVLDTKGDKKTDKNNGNSTSGSNSGGNTNATIANVGEYSGKPYVVLNANKPEFDDNELITDSYEVYSNLDHLGRCGFTMACIGRDIMPTEERGDISSVKPTGWINNRYDTDVVDGGYIYNRCHLIGFQLTGENANKQNLITGTRYMNLEGMLPFENMVADYVKETGNHVIYRVTPIFKGNNLLASGVQIEAYSVEDSGEGICFNIYAYNVQPGITIDYATGDNWVDGEQPGGNENGGGGSNTGTEAPDNTQDADYDYVLNTKSKKIHLPECSSVPTISEGNRANYSGSLDNLVDQGYTGCGNCKPLG